MEEKGDGGGAEGDQEFEAGIETERIGVSVEQAPAQNGSKGHPCEEDGDRHGDRRSGSAEQLVEIAHPRNLVGQSSDPRKKECDP